MSDHAADFYSGLVAELYETLAGHLADVEPIERFVAKAGSPSLELACGAGHPMLDLVAAGHEVDGIDSSQDMLDLCAEKAAGRGLKVQTFLQRMQALETGREYRSCYIAGASFCLLIDPGEAAETLRRVYSHLVPGGSFLFSVFRPAVESAGAEEKTAINEDGSQVSVRALSQSEDLECQTVTTSLLYRKQGADGALQQVERDWTVRWYRWAQLRALLNEAGFTTGDAYRFDGSRATGDSCNFSVVAKKPGGSR